MIPAHLQDRNIEQLRSTQETIRCFLVVPTGEGYESVTVCEDGQCVGGFNYHRTEVVVRRFQLLGTSCAYPKDWITEDEKRAKAPRYCARCGNHDFSEEARAKASGGKGRVWERTDTGERADNLNAFGPGAMWYATWYDSTQELCSGCGADRAKASQTPKGEDGKYLYWEYNKTVGAYFHQCQPGGPWNPVLEKHLGYWHPGFDTVRFANPPLVVRTPGGEWVIDSRCSNCASPSDNAHKCWPRRGDAPLVTVDKSFGSTCAAGGGSIVCGGYHGFLRNGFLVKC